MKYRVLIGGNRGDRRIEEGELVELSRAEAKGFIAAGMVEPADDGEDD